MRNRQPNSSSQQKLIPNPLLSKGALFLGIADGERVYMSPRDRSFHLLILGAIGTGKTVTIKSLARQDIATNAGLCLIDPMGPLYDDLLAYACYRKAVGCRVQEIIPFNPSDGSSWILPINPFVRVDGELSVQVDSRVSATLRVWGQHNGNETPRLEKWLKVIFSTLIDCDLTLPEAGRIIDQRAHDVRSFLIAGTKDELIGRKLAQLSHFKPSEFAEQTESVENRLMRFLSSNHLTRIFGTGKNALDIRGIMDRGDNLLIKLQPSRYLSDEQARLIGTLVLNELYETALTRPSGARPFYCYVDEAAKFVTPELAQASEQCRQKGLHLTLAFQHLAQFKEEGPRIYKAFKHIRNKLVLAVPEREDALELADDLFEGLAEPQIKLIRRHLSHLIKDVRETSTTRSKGGSQAWSENRGSSQSTSHTSGRSVGVSHGRSQSVGTGSNRGRTFTRGRSSQSATSQSRTHTEHQAHSAGFSESTSRQEQSGSSSSESANRRQHEGLILSSLDDNRSSSKGQFRSKSSGYSRTETGSDSYDSGDSETESSSSSHGASSSVGWSRSQQASRNRGSSRTWSTQSNSSDGVSRSISTGASFSTGESSSYATTDQPGTRHIPFWEEDPEHWSLEEQRWRASELLMFQDIGHWFYRTSASFGFGETRLPDSFYIRPGQLQHLTDSFYQRHNLKVEEAEKLVAERRESLMSRASFSGDTQRLDDQAPRDSSSPQPVTKGGAIWTRTEDAELSFRTQERKRGPKADSENHEKVVNIVKAFGETWTSDDNLVEICEELDKQGVPVPKTWASRSDGVARTWSRGRHHYQHLVVKAIKDRLKAARGQA